MFYLCIKSSFLLINFYLFILVTWIKAKGEKDLINSKQKLIKNLSCLRVGYWAEAEVWGRASIKITNSNWFTPYLLIHFPNFPPQILQLNILLLCLCYYSIIHYSLQLSICNGHGNPSLSFHSCRPLHRQVQRPHQRPMETTIISVNHHRYQAT